MDDKIKYNKNLLEEYFYSTDKKIESLNITSIHHYKDNLKVFILIKKNGIEQGLITNLKYTDIDFKLKRNKLNKIKKEINKKKSIFNKIKNTIWYQVKKLFV